MAPFDVEIWGTVGQWVGAFLTSGSLLLGLQVLLRERRRDEIGEASMVVCRIEGVNDQVENAVVHNLSERPIVDVSVHLRHHQGAPDRIHHVWEPYAFADVINPKTERKFEVPRLVGNERRIADLVRFQDADGNRWLRDLKTGDLRRLGSALAKRGSLIDQYIGFQDDVLVWPRTRQTVLGRLSRRYRELRRR